MFTWHDVMKSLLNLVIPCYVLALASSVFGIAASNVDPAGALTQGVSAKHVPALDQPRRVPSRATAEPVPDSSLPGSNISHRRGRGADVTTLLQRLAAHPTRRLDPCLPRPDAAPGELPAAIRVGFDGSRPFSAEARTYELLCPSRVEESGGRPGGPAGKLPPQAVFEASRRAAP